MDEKKIKEKYCHFAERHFPNLCQIVEFYFIRGDTASSRTMVKFLYLCKQAQNIYFRENKILFFIKEK